MAAFSMRRRGSSGYEALRSAFETIDVRLAAYACARFLMGQLHFVDTVTLGFGKDLDNANGLVFAPQEVVHVNTRSLVFFRSTSAPRRSRIEMS
eukprot:scaffold1688_cov140-Pinguiococcus_pyrenoidosus.AAC.2